MGVCNNNNDKIFGPLNTFSTYYENTTVASTSALPQLKAKARGWARAGGQVSFSRGRG